jgi:hypothetical protein
MVAGKLNSVYLLSLEWIAIEGKEKLMGVIIADDYDSGARVNGWGNCGGN